MTVNTYFVRICSLFFLSNFEMQNDINQAFMPNALGTNTPIPNNRPQRLRQQQQQENRIYTSKYRKKPKYSPPTKTLRKRTSDNRTKTRTRQGSNTENPKVSTSFIGCRDIRNDARTQRDSSAISRGLNCTEEHEEPVCVGFGEADV